MQKNFTKLIAHFLSTKRYTVPAGAFLLFLATSLYVLAAVIQIQVQNITVTADTALGGPSDGYTVLDPIVIQEGDQKDFGVNGTGTFTLTAPTGWAFRPTGVGAVVSNTGGQGSNLSINSITPTPTAIGINYTVSGQNRTDIITITGIALQAQTGEVLPARNVNLSRTGTATLTGFTSPTTVANIAQTHGAAAKLSFTTQPVGANIYSNLNPQPKVAIQDWFGNTVTSGAGAISQVTLAIGTNPAGGTLNGTKTETASGGVATFSGLSIDAGGEGYTLTATSGTLAPATSSTFNINSTQPVLNPIAGTVCITAGAPEQTIALTGSNFARNAVARIGGSNRTTTFVSPTELRMILLASDIATAGGKTITVVNPGPTASVSGGQTLQVNNIFENISINGDRDVCTGQSQSYWGPSSFTDYEWSVSEGASFERQSEIGYVIKIDDQVPASGKVTITVSAKNACGVVGTQSFDVIVQQSPPAVITYDTPLTFCENGSVVLKAPEAPTGETAYTYQWRQGSNNVGTNSPTFTASEAGSYSVIVTAENSCPKTSPAVTVSVTSPLTQGPVSGAAAYCMNAAAIALTATVEGGMSNTGSMRPRTYLWEQSSTGAVGSWENAIGSHTSANYTPSTANAGTTYYRRTVMAGGCMNITEHVAVTVTPQITDNSISGTQTVCSGSPIALLDGASASGDTNLDYLWEQSTTGAANSWIPAAGTNNQEDYQPTAQTVESTITTYYRRKVESGECTSYSNNVIVKITALPVATIQEGTNTYFCSPGTAVLTAAAGTNYNYAWFKEEGAADTPVGDTRVVEVALAGQYYVIVTQVTDGNSCPSTSSPITVEETIVGNNIINSQDQTICYGATPATLEGSTATSTLGTVSYQWQVSLNGADFSSITGATGVNFSPGVQTSDRWYRRVARVGSCTNYSVETIKITVLPQIVNTLTSANQTVCLNNPAQTITGSAVTGGNGEGTYTYVWYQRTGSGEWNTAPGVNDAESYTPEVSATAGTYSFRRDVISGTCAPVESNLVTVTVQPAIAGNTIGGTDIYCLNATNASALTTVGGTLTGGSGSGYTYIWQVKVGKNGAWSPVGGNTPNLVPSTAQAGEFYFKRTVSSGSCVGAESNEFKVTILPSVVNTISEPTSYGYCQNTTASALTGTVSGGDGTNYTYVWQRSTNGNDSWSAAPGTNNQASYTPSTATAGTVYYRRTVSSGVCATPVASNVVSVTVIPAIANNTISGPASVCFNSQPGLLIGSTPTNGGGPYTYLWEQSTGGTTWTAAVGTNNEQTYQPPVLTATTQYRRTVYAGTCIPNVSATHTVNVTPLPTVNFTGIQDGATVYSGQGNITLTGSPSGGTWSWSGGTSSTFSPCTAFSAAVPAGATQVTVPITYTVTSGGCQNSITKNVTITQSTFRVIVSANIYPNCRGDKVEYTAKVYRDPEAVIYPYLANSDGVPLDEEGNLLGDQELVIANEAYFALTGKPVPPPVIVANAFRYYQAEVIGGTPVPAANFTYQWTKNKEVFPGSDRIEFENAGLSSLDYYAVIVTPKAGAICGALLSTVSNRSYSANRSNDYTIAISATPNPICQGQPVTLTATLNSDYPYWGLIEDLTINWMVNRSGTRTQLAQTTYDPETGDGLEVVISGPSAGGFEDGDEVYIDFSSELSDPLYNGSGKCAGRVTTSPSIVLDVNDIIAVADPVDQSTTVCLGGGATFNAPVTTTGPGTVNYVWTVGGTTYPASTSSSLTVGSDITAVAGVYPVSVVVSNTCDETTPSLAVGNLTVRDLASFTVSGGGSYCTNVPESFPINLSGSETGVNYTLWRGTDLVQTLAGTGSALEFTPQSIAGNYKVQAAYATEILCAEEMAGSATVTANAPSSQFGDLEVTWINNMTQWEVVASQYSESYGANPTFTWYTRSTGQTDEQWVRVTPANNTNTLIVNNPAEDLEIKAEVLTTDGTCQAFVLTNIGVTILPVEIIYLNASKQGNNVLLEWATAMEQDNAGFEVQVSTDGFTYRKLTFVPAKNGNASTRQEYAFTDKENGKFGTRYYRLKQLDTNGTHEYFGPKAVSFGSVASQVIAFPNPFHDEVTLDIASETAGEALITVTDAVGKQLLVRRVQVEKGFTTEKLRLDAGLPRGLYIIKAQVGGVTQYIKMIKE